MVFGECGPSFSGSCGIRNVVPEARSEGSEVLHQTLQVGTEMWTRRSQQLGTELQLQS